VVSYIDVIRGNCGVGKRLSVMRIGGTGFDVFELIMHSGVSGALDRDIFAKEWNIDFENHPRGGFTCVKPEITKADREVYLLQHKSSPVG
jgi:2,4-dienoyl-CoA reductase (NADPH2)